MDLAEPLQKKLRRLFSDAIRKNADAPLRSVLLVGAKMAGEDLSSSDRTHCRKTAALLREHGLTLAPDCAISYINLAETNEDFLAGTHRADLLVFCYLFNPKAGASYKKLGDFKISPRHHALNAWHDAAAAAGARAIAVFGQSEVFSLDDKPFDGPAFVKRTTGAFDTAHLLTRRAPG